METCCRLCHSENVPLKESHIVSKMFYNVIKKKSPTGIMRQVTDPNKGIQDGIKLPFLCDECEELFSKYETYFSNNIYIKTVQNDGIIEFNSRDDNISYFLLSISWRVMKWVRENDKTTFTNLENEQVDEVIETWRKLLKNENMYEIRKIQQFIIPTQKLKFFQNINFRVHDNVMLDFKTFDKEDTFRFAFTIVQVSYFIFITTVWGNTDTMKQYRLGKIIKPHESDLPKNITNILYDKHYIPLDEYEQEPTAYADAFWIKPEMLDVENGICYFDFELSKDLMWTVDSYRTQWFIGGLSNYRLFLLQFLMYLSSKEPDIIESPDTANTYKPSTTIKNKYSEVRKWDVGCRYGEKIRGFKKNKMQQFAINGDNNQNSKRPHIRKAHWERYHIGKGRKDIITKWKEPVFINGDYNDITANIHVVTDKEVECSSGEELIKQYLKSKNISYRKEHYVREIRKRYDFSFEWNNILVFIEYDGEQHFKSINRWKGRKGYLERNICYRR